MPKNDLVKTMLAGLAAIAKLTGAVEYFQMPQNGLKMHTQPGVHTELAGAGEYFKMPQDTGQVDLVNVVRV
ncbi:uncharacterized protein N7479_000405 [Penicillium vulpinum]|uniref:uncharacterized protein n=1 Tax=Penicillium vulpinum TaxID=29845 RepID=UPI0025473A60|nr:uncharacterized protein N7479_000405 [Penicillium vulpinum]KAJ5970487.1 hypothetical protein N7479_000405 [Penicillium vulpinum]